MSLPSISLRLWPTPAAWFGLALILTGCASGRPANSAICGDGLLQKDETCDDGNTAPGDGCDKQCLTEPGFQCDAAQPTVCDPICGDGLVVGEEACDGSELGGRTCASLNLGDGTLACDEGCELDPSGCTAYSCGNGVRDEAEACDGADFGDDTCLLHDYDGGSLACSSLCALDLSGCTLASCGNGIVEGIEGCDDGGAAAGDGCGPNCAVEPGWDCAGQPSVCTLLCGNGALDEGEQCDQDLLGGNDCTTIGQSFEGGTLSCGTDCQFDTSLCELPTCGNGAIDAGEDCDGALMGGATCQTQGFLSGTLACAASCSFDTTPCVPHRCGDGVVSGGEACDDLNTTGSDGCNQLCNVEAGWTCSGTPSVCTRLCGNGTIDPGEQCDGANLGSATCQTLNFDSGTLACASTCQYDTSGCRNATCGDGHKDAGEDCDGADFGTATCQTLGFVSGMLQCTVNCGYNTSSCVAPVCGDGIISSSANEQCDDQDTTSGDGCNAACQVEVGWICAGEPSVCTPSCGNGVWNAGESCDGADLHGGTCLTQGFAGGTLGCTASCTYDTSGCLASICPNGVKEGSEACDTTDFGGQTCATFGFAGGNLACDGSCQISTTGCTNAVCGNSAVEAGETCDDGNTSSNDGCSSACQWENTCTADGSMACGGSNHQSSDPSGNNASGYNCTSYGTGDDYIYSFTPATSGTAYVWVTCDDWDDDYDTIILRGGCHPNNCIAYSAGVSCDDVSFPVVAGTTYFIVIEEYFSPWYGYTVELDCP